jgi:hypothetical protein
VYSFGHETESAHESGPRRFRSELALGGTADEMCVMNLPEAEQDFLRDLVKASRQRPRYVRWVDRDGSERITTLSEADGLRLHALARQLGVAADALLRQAAHLPAAKRASRIVD